MRLKNTKINPVHMNTTKVVQTDPNTGDNKDTPFTYPREMGHTPKNETSTIPTVESEQKVECG